MADDLTPREQRLFADIAQILQSARAKAYRAVNTTMVETYWQMGRRIVEKEQQGKERAGYGEALIVNLSRYLGETFGKGFSVANLWNFRQFYLTFPDFGQFSTHRVGNLAWSHIRLIMRLNSEPERRYYLEEASGQNWSVRLLERNIQSGYYRRLLSSQSGRSSVAPSATPAMSMYVRMFDELKRGADDNPRLGILLCADKDETVVRYSVLRESQQLFASKYQTVLPTEEELAAMLEREKPRVPAHGG